MLVGIMTMHRVPNYGSFLQAYSLKKIVESLGHDVVFIDFRVEPDIEHRGDVGERFRCSMRRAAQGFKATTPGHLLRRVVKGNKPSSRSIMFSCDNLLGITDKRRYNTKCDVLIIGSDEVFNCLQLGPNIGYSLELFGYHANASKIVSYAASFGNTTIEKLKFYGVAEEIGDRLRGFDEISVRDSNSASVVKGLTDRSPLIHLDPVLVGGVEGDVWRDCDACGFVILYGYSFRFTKDECAVAMKFAHSRGLRLIALGEDQFLRDAHVRCRPDQVLPFFSNADYVITDTFHGTIFSVVSHTKFVTIPRSDCNGQGGNVQKLTTLLDVLKLSDRCVATLEELDDVLPLRVDFASSDAIRKIERRKSLDYLQCCLD